MAIEIIREISPEDQTFLIFPRFFITDNVRTKNTRQIQEKKKKKTHDDSMFTTNPLHPRVKMTVELRLYVGY